MSLWISAWMCARVSLTARGEHRAHYHPIRDPHAGCVCRRERAPALFVYNPLRGSAMNRTISHWLNEHEPRARDAIRTSLVYSELTREARSSWLPTHTLACSSFSLSSSRDDAPFVGVRARGNDATSRTHVCVYILLCAGAAKVDRENEEVIAWVGLCAHARRAAAIDAFCRKWILGKFEIDQVSGRERGKRNFSDRFRVLKICPLNYSYTARFQSCPRTSKLRVETQR